MEGKVVVITGASSGIGAETARHFARLKCKLMLTARSHQKLAEVSKECHQLSGVLPSFVVGDITEEPVVKEVIENTIKIFGKLDVLINNAGGMAIGSIETTSIEQYDEMFNVNVKAVYRLTMLATSHLIQSQGCIVNVSSVCGMRAFPGVLAYCMSKAALEQMTKCLALELAPNGVRVNAVSPGVIVTPLQMRAGMTEDNYRLFIDRCKETHALGRAGLPSEVSHAIEFLADSNKSSFITGVCLSVDGGRHAMTPR